MMFYREDFKIEEGFPHFNLLLAELNISKEDWNKIDEVNIVVDQSRSKAIYKSQGNESQSD